MSYEITYKCDHCGEVVPPYIGKHWSTSFCTIGTSMPEMHGCTKEHLGLALAKAFGIDINWKMVDAIEAKDLEISDRDKRILDLEKQLAALRTNAPSFTDNTKPTKPLAGAGANELVEALDLALPEATCISCDDGPEKHRITVSVKWCNHSEVVAEYLPSLTGPKKPTKPARIAINPREVIEEPALESVFCECDRMVLPNGTIKHLPHCPLSEDS